ncbi:MAG: A/G-specific adenine glycosylase [Bdellovibrionales bacterium]
MTLFAAKQKLLEWFHHNKREFPWRLNRDPYRIWISETMLQQTTTTAVIPFFERFVKRFPDLESLAQAPVESVLEAWAGLGYYSRARNLHRAAQELRARGEFPRDYREWIVLPGLGPYTARAVASLAFDQSVGVVDGNVIRVISRIYEKDWEWWRPSVREQVQNLADEWVQDVSSPDMNQALMELGRTVCTPKSPVCLLCPVRAHCKAFAGNRASELPRPRPRREPEVWVWEPVLDVHKGRIRLVRNTKIPFLRGQWLLPGLARKVRAKPREFDYKHSITHHLIYVTVTRELPTMDKVDTMWVPLKEIQQHVPTSLVQKALARLDRNRASRRVLRPGLEERKKRARKS